MSNANVLLKARNLQNKALSRISSRSSFYNQ
jgi:hypothetical protein